MERGAWTTGIRRHWRVLGVIVLAVAISSGGTVLAAGGTRDEALLVGAVGLVVGAVVAAYVYHLATSLRRW